MHCGCKLNYVWWLSILGTKSLKHIVCATKLCLVEYLKAIQHCNLVIGVWNVFTSNFDPWIETVQSLSDPTRFAILCLSKVFKLILIVSLGMYKNYSLTWQMYRIIVSMWCPVAVSLFSLFRFSLFSIPFLLVPYRNYPVSYWLTNMKSK